MIIHSSRTVSSSICDSIIFILEAVITIKSTCNAHAEKVRHFLRISDIQQVII